MKNSIYQVVIFPNTACASRGMMGDEPCKVYNVIGTLKDACLKAYKECKGCCLEDLSDKEIDELSQDDLFSMIEEELIYDSFGDDGFPILIQIIDKIKNRTIVKNSIWEQYSIKCEKDLIEELLPFLRVKNDLVFQILLNEGKSSKNSSSWKVIENKSLLLNTLKTYSKNSYTIKNISLKIVDDKIHVIINLKV